MKRSRLTLGLLTACVLSLGIMLTGPFAEPALAAEGALGAGASASMSASTNSALEAQATKYDVWVGGTQVTSKNAKNVLGNGTVSFNAKTNTLTLKNAKITKAYVKSWRTLKTGEKSYWNYGIYSGKTLTVKLVGKNTIKTPCKKSPVMNYGIFSKGSIVLSGAGSLTATSNKAQAYSMGILASGNLTLQGSVKVTSKGASTKVTSKGIDIIDQYGGYGVSFQKLTMKGSAQLIASGPDGAIYKHDNPTVSFGSGYTPLVKAGASATSLKVNKKSPAKSVYTKYKYVNIAKAKTSSGGTFTIKNLKADVGTLDVTWTKSKKPSGYQIQLCTARDFKSGSLVDVKYTTSSSGNWSGISKGSNFYSLFGGYTYYVRGRTFDVLGVSEFGNFGKWSAVKKVKVP